MIENPTKEQLKTLRMIIYIITNLINGKQYVGQTINTFQDRYHNVWKYNTNNLLKSALIKYGQENFKISILEYEITSQKELDNLETLYIKKLETLSPNGYNLEKSPRGTGKRHQ